MVKFGHTYTEKHLIKMVEYLVNNSLEVFILFAEDEFCIN